MKRYGRQWMIYSVEMSPRSKTRIAITMGIRMTRIPGPAVSVQ